MAVLSRTDIAYLLVHHANGTAPNYSGRAAKNSPRSLITIQIPDRRMIWDRNSFLPGAADSERHPCGAVVFGELVAACAK
jgi:hypothetical protein